MLALVVLLGLLMLTLDTAQILLLLALLLLVEAAQRVAIISPEALAVRVVGVLITALAALVQQVKVLLVGVQLLPTTTTGAGAEHQKLVKLERRLTLALAVTVNSG